jgi:hypothetical protein
VVWRVFHKYVSPGGVAVSMVLRPAQMETSAPAFAVGEVKVLFIKIDSVAVQELSSVTVTVYVPGVSPLISWVVAAVFHKYV